MRRALGLALTAGLAGTQAWLAASVGYLLALLAAGARSGVGGAAAPEDPRPGWRRSSRRTRRRGASPTPWERSSLRSTRPTG